MRYKCKILTPEFFARVEKDIKERCLAEAEEKIPQNVEKRETRVKAYARYKEISAWSGNCMIWNRNFDPKDEELFSQWEFFNPEYTEETFDRKEEGLQSQPRIEWKGEIRKVEDIREIFSLASVV